MKVTYKSVKANCIFEFEASDVKDGFDKLAAIQEIYEPEKCGNCGSEAFQLSRRDVSKGNKTYTYRDIVCRKCFYQLGLGQKVADQSLFPQRKDKDGNLKDNFGWTKFEIDSDE